MRELFLKLRKFLSVKKAFTATELMLAMTTIGTVMALTAPNCTDIIESVRAVEAVNMMGSMRTAENIYKIETGSYTQNVKDLLLKLPDPAAPAYWTYSIDEASDRSFVITATRTAKRAPEGFAGQTITFTWDDRDLAAWSGNHTGVPHQ